MARTELPRLVQATGALPEPDRGAGLCAEGVERWDGPDGRPLGAAARFGGRWVVAIAGVGRFAFVEGGAEVGVVRQDGCSEARLEDTWLRHVLPLVVQAGGTEVLHASAIELAEGVVALAGHAGAGKSTMAWALHRCGCRLWSDDALAFEPGATGYRTRPLPFRLRLRPDVLRALGEDAAPTADKVVVRAEERPDPEPRPLLRIVVLVPGRAGSAPVLEPVAPAAAFPLLIEQAWGLGLHEPERRRRLVERYLALAAGVTIARFARGDDLRTLDAQAAQLVRALGVPPTGS